MTRTVTIALDAMGGDRAPDIVIKGIKRARKRFPETRFLLFGDAKKLEKLLKKKAKKARDACEIRHTEDIVSNDEKVAVALRQGRSSSMWLAIQAVKKGEADAVVSAGNTGAYMAMSKLLLRTLPGIDRPGFASVLPTIRGESIMLDLGANAECNANNLVEFALMGEVFARILLGVKHPTVGLLNDHHPSAAVGGG
ncbi:MAG: phosphate acyltransferase, partial [Rhodospirillaceae bacterium]